MVRRATGDLPRLFDEGPVAALGDGELLGRFLDRRGDAGPAFGAIVARHGPMVARVCRGVLGREADAEDAFQATFLVLVRRAGSIGERELLGPWLYRVALRVARRARGDAARRVGREGGQVLDGFDPPDRATAGRPGPWVDDAPTLLEEVDRLPSRYRLPVVLCHLQGLTHAEAAAQLAWPVGTVSVRLARARRLLAERLARRGVGVPASGVMLPPVVALPVAPAWLARAVAALEAAHRLPLAPVAAVAPAAASRGALSLARRTAPMFLLAPWKWFALPAATLLAAGVGVALVTQNSGPTGPDAGRATQQAAVSAPATQSGSAANAGLIAPPADGPRLRSDSGPTVTLSGGVRVQDPDGTLDVEVNDLLIQTRPLGARSPKIQRVGSKLQVEAAALDARGSLDDLDRLVPDLTRTDPGAHVRLRLMGGGGCPVLYRTGSDPKNDFPAGGQITAEEIKFEGAPGQLAEIVRRLYPNDRHAITFQLQIEGGTVRFEGVAPGDAPPAIPPATLPPPSPTPAESSRPRPAPDREVEDGRPTVPPPSELQPAPSRGASARPTDGRPMPADEPEPGPAVEPGGEFEVVPPLVRKSDRGPELDVGLIDPPPPGYFDLPAPPPGRANRPEPVRVGQTLHVEVLEGLPGRPLNGERVVRSDGTISLGFYGDLPVAGLDRDQIKVKLIERLRRHLTDPTLGLAVVTSDQKKAIAVPPLESNRVFVDDQPAARGSGRPGPAQAAADADRPAPGEAPAPGRPADQPAPLAVGQVLVVEVLEALPGRPLGGEHAIRRDGTIGLGFYGDVPVVGLTPREAKVRIVEHLQKFLGANRVGLLDGGGDPATPLRDVPPADSARVFVLRVDPAAYRRAHREPGPDGRIRVGQVVAVEALEGLDGRPITGEHLVEADGTINLGFYGEVALAGLTRREAKVRVIEHLRRSLTDQQLGLIGDVGRAVDPADSAKVFVEDTVPGRPAEPAAGAMAKQLSDLSGKLDAALAEIEQLRRDRAGAPPADPRPR